MSRPVSRNSWNSSNTAKKCGRTWAGRLSTACQNCVTRMLPSSREPAAPSAVSAWSRLASTILRSASTSSQPTAERGCTRMLRTRGSCTSIAIRRSAPPNVSSNCRVEVRSTLVGPVRPQERVGYLRQQRLPPVAVEEQPLQVQHGGLDLGIGGQGAEAVGEGLGHGRAPVQVLALHQFLHHRVDGRSHPVALSRIPYVQRVERHRPLGVGEIEQDRVVDATRRHRRQQRLYQVALGIEHEQAVALLDDGARPPVEEGALAHARGADHQDVLESVVGLDASPAVGRGFDHP